MPTLSRLVTSWSGSPVVGPGATVTYCNEGDESTCLTALATFFNAVKAIVPVTVTWTFPNSGDKLDEATNKVTGVWSASAPGPVVSTGSATGFVNGVGARAIFPTIGIVNGRKVTGSIFIVPLFANAYEGAGNITASMIATIGPAAATLGTTPNAMRVYSRPKPAHAGISFPTLTGSCPDKVSWLRSRRN